MHPPLYRDHPLCEKAVEDLVRCHKEHNIAKWWGHCNEIKTALDKCFREEKKYRVANNKKMGLASWDPQGEDK